MFSRRIRTTKLLRYLQSVQAGLQTLSDDSQAIPSPSEMKALAKIRWLLNTLPEQAETCEKDCWKRIHAWQNTPYTPRQQFTRAILAFFGWWVLGTITLSYSVMGWFVSLFPQPWHSLVLSAAISFIAVAYFSYHESSSKRR